MIFRDVVFKSSSRMRGGLAVVQVTMKQKEEVTFRRRRHVMSKSESCLLFVLGAIVGTEVIGAPVLMLLALSADLDPRTAPAVFGLIGIACAILGGLVGYLVLPRFPRNRGRTADLGIDPRRLGTGDRAEPARQHLVRQAGRSHPV